MEEFKQTYFEECEDRLQDAEGGLSSMLEGDADQDVINSVFRAIHSIKGGAGAFGFKRLVEFTHEFETTLDDVRNGKLDPDRDVCNLFLSANDIVASLIEKERNGEDIDADFGEHILIKLSACRKGETSEEEADEHSFTWSIIFRPQSDILNTGNDPYHILRALSDLGELDVTAETDKVPICVTDTSIDQCYLSWRCVLNTAAPQEDIEDVFIFVDDICELSIERQNVPPGHMKERRAANAQESAIRHDRRQEDRDLRELLKDEHGEGTASATQSAVGVKALNNQSGGKTIRVDLNRIDQLVNLVGEMVIAQSMLSERVLDLPIDAGDGQLSEGVLTLNRHMHDLQQSVMAVRAQPIKSVFTRMPRIVREVSGACGKDVRLATFGEETEVDKTVLESLVDPLTHMIRNSIDHGIEAPQERLAAQKQPFGTIKLSARHRSGRIIIEIEDDGKGINRDAVLAKAKAQNLLAEDAQLSPNEIDNLIFKAGFSTADKVSEVSGRGVGMDVVKRNIASLNGRVSVTSRPGKGCCLTLSLPLTLAVMDGMVVSVGAERFVLPTVNIIESFRPDRTDVKRLTNDTHVVKARGEYVRIVPICNVLGVPHALKSPDQSLLILLENDEESRIAVMVDDVLGQQQVVIKSLETNFAAVNGISAATILGNGDVALILDVAGLSAMAPAALRIEELGDEKLDVVLVDAQSETALAEGLPQ